MTRKIWISSLLAAGIAAAVLALSGCPAKNEQKPADGAAANSTAPANKTAGSDAPEAKAPDAPVAGESVEGTAEADPANPKPTGSEWVWSSKLNYRIGEKIDVEFKSAGGEKAWVGLIPADIKAEDAASNDAADISYAYLPADTNMLQLNVPDTGLFVLKLISGSEATDKVLFTSPVITVTQWEKGDRATKVAPYITLGEQTKPGQITLPTGAPLPVYWMLPEIYPDSAWVAMVPVSITATDDAANDAADVDYQYIKAGTQGTLTFFLKEPGDYVFRIFPSNELKTEMVAESEPFTVVPAAGS